jgi:1-phosphatidylinositol-4-phosphate 5-kinase
MRTLTLHQIQIKNVDKWDEAQAKDFVKGSHDDAFGEADDHDRTLTINEEVKTTEYAPAIFSAIRKMDGITDQMVQSSLDVQANRTQVFKAKESAGKSGSFFFFSHDRQFLLKTMNDREMKVFKGCLP